MKFEGGKFPNPAGVPAGYFRLRKRSSINRNIPYFQIKINGVKCGGNRHDRSDSAKYQICVQEESTCESQNIVLAMSQNEINLSDCPYTSALQFRFMLLSVSE